MADIVLTTLNAKYLHTAFGLRYLRANLGPLRSRSQILEFDINQRPLDIAEALLGVSPKVIGLGVYIWNVAAATQLVAALKRIAPDVIVVLGGPEVSYETEGQPIVEEADYVITGEADLKFAEVCAKLLDGERPVQRIIEAELPDLSHVILPYDEYDGRDIAHRVVYVEASRGCPFSCEFCLSSVDIPVRRFPLEAFLEHIGRLLDRGARQLKFVDRTFNLDQACGQRILDFLLARYQPGHFFHFEMVPDRLPEALRDRIRRFPPGALQLELGIQTFNADAASLIQRRQDYEKLEDNFRFLRRETGAHLHADLIVGLPGESLESFAIGFDRLVSLAPHEIQVGLLKRLRGTTISRHDADQGMVYSPYPPYELLQNKWLDFATVQRLRRFGRYWDLVANSGNFLRTTPLIWSGNRPESASPFQAFLTWSDWLCAQSGRTDGIALIRLMEFLFRYLTDELQLDAVPVAHSLWDDYRRGGRRDKPSFLKEFLPGGPSSGEPERTPRLPRRQARHAVSSPAASCIKPGAA